MSTSAQQAVETTAQEAREINVKVVGHQHISKKLFDVVMHLLVKNEIHTYEDCINVVEFSEDEPEGKFGGFGIEDKDVIINLQKHFDKTCEAVEDTDLSLLSFRGHLWFALLTTTIHEILHAIAYAIDPDTVLNTDRETLEGNIKEETAVHLTQLIRDYDVEPPLFEDDPFFGPLYMEFYIKKIKENAEQWAINQNELHNTGFMWKEDDVVINTFREWYRIAYDHSDDHEWDKAVEPLMAADVVDEVNDETIVAVGDDTEDVIAAQQAIELPAGPVEQVAEVAAQTTGADIVAAPTPQPLDIDPESLLALYNAEEPMDLPDSVDDYGTAGFHTVSQADPTSAPKTEVAKPVESTQVNTVQTSAPAPNPVPTVQTQLPLNTAQAPSTETRCRSCQQELAAQAKFCSFCGTSVEETPKPILPSQRTTTQTMPVQNAPVYQQAPMATNLPNHNLSAEQIRACVGDIFARCWHHIYTKCGFAPGQNPQFLPELRNSVAEPLSVLGIPCVDKILVAMDCTDQMGNYTKHAPVVNGMIRGKVTKNKGLPSYTLYLNFNGIEVKRLIVPQNMWKTNAQGGYSAPAGRAQQGAMIAWLMEGDDNAPGKKWKAKIENGQLEWLI